MQETGNRRRSTIWEAIAICRKQKLSPDYFRKICSYIGDTDGKADDYYKVIIRTREIDIEGKRQAGNNLRQPLLVTSTAAIGLVTYQLLPLAVCQIQKDFLYASWALFIISFLSVVISYFFALYAYETKIKLTDNLLNLRKEKNEKEREDLEIEMQKQWTCIEGRNICERTAIIIGSISFLLGVIATGALAVQVF